MLPPPPPEIGFVFSAYDSPTVSKRRTESKTTPIVSKITHRFSGHDVDVETNVNEMIWVDVGKKEDDPVEDKNVHVAHWHVWMQYEEVELCMIEL